MPVHVSMQVLSELSETDKSNLQNRDQRNGGSVVSTDDCRALFMFISQLFIKNSTAHLGQCPFLWSGFSAELQESWTASKAQIPQGNRQGRCQ